MDKRLLTSLVFISLAFPLNAHAGTIYKCVKGDKIVFSQVSCPKEFRQHEIEYQLGVVTETDSDKPKETKDPLKALLAKESLSKEQLLHLIDGELYRLKQENSYYEILRASELQKLDRKRYWQKKAKDDPEFLAQIDKMDRYFDDLIKINADTLALLEQHKHKIEATIGEEDTDKSQAQLPKTNIN
ncbi:DUF4124 domain-containing protein [Shewanella sp. AS1]|uniref:DUF4124 domain-containing protein n=1 Tax=Shewanella sp. AS1 TaxID=2907626 RepID=UPI001F18F0EB|nr:DUF4124 domain-containing protein [Shewanella sp. AS1]MCE9677703.1 DUF4124 domain-containing protein [Shewanella sp. AS1]